LSNADDRVFVAKRGENATLLRTFVAQMMAKYYRGELKVPTLKYEVEILSRFLN
jgi:hypothetical protein